MSFVMAYEFSLRFTKITSRMSHELSAYLSIFNQFKLNDLWPYQKHVKQIILNSTTL